VTIKQKNSLWIGRSSAMPTVFESPWPSRREDIFKEIANVKAQNALKNIFDTKSYN